MTKRFILLSLYFRLIIIFSPLLVAGCGRATPVAFTVTTMPLTTTPTLTQKLSTLQLIDQAYANGEITAEYRLLYLAYALYEYESLPAQFRGNAGWRGTSAVIELYKVNSDPSVICSMSPYVGSEFQRLFNLEMSCK